MSNAVSFTLPSLNNPQLNALNSPNKARLRLGLRSRVVASCIERKRFLGTRFRPIGSDRIRLLQSCRLPKPRVAVRLAFSAVPEKPLGLYDPAMDKDSCGVGFVAELSGESSRKTVRSGLGWVWFGFWWMWCGVAFMNEG